MREAATRMAKFGTVGAANTALDIAIFTAGVGVLGASPVLSNIAAFLAAATLSFVCNQSWTFADRTRARSTRRAYAAFITLNSATGLAATAVLGLLLTAGTGLIVAKAVSMGVSFSLNFYFMDKIIFRNRAS
ncbi:MAG: GtrA family protein [Pseudomonadota bacterium]